MYRVQNKLKVCFSKKRKSITSDEPGLDPTSTPILVQPPPAPASDQEHAQKPPQNNGQQKTVPKKRKVTYSLFPTPRSTFLPWPEPKAKSNPSPSASQPEPQPEPPDQDQDLDLVSALYLIQPAPTPTTTQEQEQEPSKKKPTTKPRKTTSSLFPTPRSSFLPWLESKSKSKPKPKSKEKPTPPSPPPPPPPSNNIKSRFIEHFDKSPILPPHPIFLGESSSTTTLVDSSIDHEPPLRHASSLPQVALHLDLPQDLEDPLFTYEFMDEVLTHNKKEQRETYVVGGGGYFPVGISPPPPTLVNNQAIKPRPLKAVPSQRRPRKPKAPARNFEHYRSTWI